MSKTDPKPSFPDLGFEEPHTPPQQEAQPSNLRLADDPKKRFSRPSRLPSKHRALLRRATSQYFAEKQSVRDQPVKKQGPESAVGEEMQGPSVHLSKKLSFREAAQVLGDFEAQKKAVVSPEGEVSFLREEAADTSRATRAQSEMASANRDGSFSTFESSRGPLAESHVSEPGSGLDPEGNVPSTVASLNVLAADTERRNSEDNRPYNLPAPEFFDLPEIQFPEIRSRANAPPGYSGSESEDDVTEQYRGSQSRSGGPPRSYFHERLRAYEALNWESPDELERSKAPGDPDERRVSAEGRLTGGEYRGPGVTDRRAKFATVGARASAAYDIRGSPVSDTRAMLVDQENVSLIDR